MPAQLTSVKAFPCTFAGCAASFDTERKLHNHKKNDDDHDYCFKCKKDFDSYDDLARHKAFAPDVHNKACRVCGEEFKSESGLKRHIELSHKVKQKLPCIGCGEEFPAPALLIEHLEFGHCEVISSQQFMGHVVHKHLVSQLLQGGDAYARFMQKTSQYEAALDHEDEGGVFLENILEEDEEEARAVDHPAIQPEILQEIVDVGPWPHLAQGRSLSGSTNLATDMDGLSLGGSQADTAVSAGESGAASRHQTKTWGGRSAKALFPHAKPTPPQQEFTIEAVDRQTERQHGPNIFKTRFWDPLTNDWNPERFYNSVIQKYFCPFMCEQTYETAGEMREHILVSHRVSRAKCPYCLKYFDSVTALMCHCQSRGSRCQINKTEDFGDFLNKLTGGFLSVEEKVRPDHIQNETVEIMDKETGEMMKYTPPVAKYLEYTASTPTDWKSPTRVAARIGGGNALGTFSYQNQQARW